MSIREAKEQDIPRLVEMGSRSLREGAYKDMISDNRVQTATLAEQVINQSGKVLVAEENGQLVGLLAMFIGPHFFSGEIIATELMWYCEPEYRRSFTAIGLLRAAEKTARNAGAKSMIFTAPTQEVEQAYKCLGYHWVEANYRKAL